MELWNMAEDRGCIGPRPPLPPDAELEPLPLRQEVQPVDLGFVDQAQSGSGASRGAFLCTTGARYA